MGATSSFSNSSQNIPDKNQYIKKARKRLKLRHEKEKERHVRARAKTLPKCSFCKLTDHNKIKCPRISELLVHFKKVDDRRSFIERLCVSQPMLDPIDNVKTSTNALQNSNHVIAHKNIYAMAKSSTNSHRRLEMSQMFFTVATLSNENVSSLRKETLVNGGELEHYIHNTANIKDRLLLDGTQYNTMSSMFKMRNA